MDVLYHTCQFAERGRFEAYSFRTPLPFSQTLRVVENIVKLFKSPRKCNCALSPLLKKRPHHAVFFIAERGRFELPVHFRARHLSKVVL